MKKIIGFVFLFLIVSGVYAQRINTYKYIIVPKKFNVLKDTNQYQLNVLTKQLFTESGFTAVYNDDLPEDLERNSCLGLKAELGDDSGMFTTRLKITLRDCKNTTVFTSAEGKSRGKEYRQAYQEALRTTFKSIAALHYAYTPEPVEQPERTEGQPVVKNTVPVKTPLPDPVSAAKTLYAQPVANGFQLVDSTPKIVYILQNTGLDDVFILKDKNGILYKKDTAWIAEYYNETGRVSEVLNIRF